MSIPCKMNPLGSGEGERFPLGYKRLEYLENIDRAFIEMPYYLDDDLGVKCVYLDRNANTDTPFVSCSRINDQRQRFYVPYCSAGTQYYGWRDWFTSGNFNNAGILTYASLNYRNNREWQMVAGLYKNSGALTIKLSPAEKQKLRIFSYYNEGNPARYVKGSLYSLEISKGNAVVSQLIPALDPFGRPCMFDTVTRKPLRNQGTGEFIAGMTVKQARHLAYLPATGGNLTISLPLAAAFDEKVQNALTTASEKGWIFTFYWTEVTEYLTPIIDAIVGAGNYTISYDYTTRKLSLAFELSVTSEQIAEIQTLLDRELLSNLVVEMQYANGLPIMDGYMPLEYVDTVKRLWHDSIITTNAPDIEADIMFVKNGNSNEYTNWYLFNSEVDEGYFGNPRLLYTICGWGNMGITMCNDGKNQTYFPHDGWSITNRLNEFYDKNIPTLKNKRRQYHFHDCGYTVDGEFYQFDPPEVQNGINWGKMSCFAGRGATSGSGFRIYKWTVRQNGVMTADLVPCVRTEDGTPGFWCNIYKKFYDQAPVVTLDLDWDDDEDNGVYYLTEEEITALGIDETDPPVDISVEEV